MKETLEYLETLKERLSLELNKGRIPEDEMELIEIAEDLDAISEVIEIIKTYDTE